VLRIPYTRFSPFQLRPLLREALDGNEQIIGWGVAQKKPDGPQRSLILLATLMPGPGTLLAASLSFRISRFLILTDRRLLVMLPDPSGVDVSRKGVTLDTPIERLSITRLGGGQVYLLHLEGWPTPERLELRSHDSPVCSRLAHAFGILAQEEADRSAGPL